MHDDNVVNHAVKTLLYLLNKLFLCETGRTIYILSIYRKMTELLNECGNA